DATPTDDNSNSATANSDDDIQHESDGIDGSVRMKHKDKDTLPTARNSIKVNLTSAVFSNIYLTYERKFNKHWGFLLGGRYMPTQSLQKLFPFSLISALKNISINGGNFSFSTSKINVTAWQVTPEIRYYFGKGYQRGFYLGAYARYTNYSLAIPTQFSFVETNYNLKANYNLSFSGKISSYTGGLVFGIQYPITKWLEIDVWLLGVSIGSFDKLSFTGSVPALDSTGRGFISDFTGKIPSKLALWKSNVSTTQTASTTTINAQFSGPAVGIRGIGINLGFKF
ncbi:MAG: DUF3575 domain-containing protein, partial [Phycisphaerales bacterium]|nr:DUF3575 domain-containing protein [Phycisphaerales bacterium]